MNYLHNIHLKARMEKYKNRYKEAQYNAAARLFVRNSVKNYPLTKSEVYEDYKKITFDLNKPDTLPFTNKLGQTIHVGQENIEWATSWANGEVILVEAPCPSFPPQSFPGATKL